MRRLVFRCALALFVTVASSHAETHSDFHWGMLRNTLSQIRENIESTGTVATHDTSILQTQIHTLLENEKAFDEVLIHLAGEGLLEGQPIVKDMHFILETLKALPPEAPEVEWLKDIGFPSLALRFAQNTLQTLAPETDTTTPHSQIASKDVEDRQDEILVEAPPLLETEIRKNRAEIDELAKRFEAHLVGPTENFLQASQNLEKLVFRIHSGVFALSAAAGLLATMGSFNYGELLPREWVGLIGVIWAASSGSHYVMWKFFNWIEPLKRWTLRGDDRRWRNSWIQLLALSPRFVTRYAAAAASDIPAPTVRYAGAKENIALEALIESDTELSTQKLFDVALQSEENGNTRRANSSLKEVIRRSEGSPLAVKARRIRDAIRAKNRLENAIFFRQVALAGFRIVTVGLGLWAINVSVESLLPEMVSRWRSVAIAMVGAIGSRRILEFLWQPLHEERVDALFKRRRDILIHTFRQLHELDPSGNLVSRMTRCNHSRTAHRYLTEAALVVLEEHPNHEVTGTIEDMLERELGAADISVSMAQNLTRSVFSHYRRCQNEILSLAHTVPELVGITHQSPVSQPQQGFTAPAP